MTLFPGSYNGPRAVIATAAYFRAGWEVSFDRELTYWGTFNLDDGGKKEVQFMKMKNSFPYVADERLGVKMIEIPFFHNVASLVVIIPIKRTTTLQSLLQNLVANFFTELHMQRRMKMVELTIPKVLIDCSFDIKSLFNLVGIKEVFNDASELPKLTSEKTFRISEGIHKCAFRKYCATSISLKGSSPVPCARRCRVI